VPLTCLYILKLGTSIVYQIAINYENTRKIPAETLRKLATKYRRIPVKNEVISEPALRIGGTDTRSGNEQVTFIVRQKMTSHELEMVQTRLRAASSRRRGASGNLWFFYVTLSRPRSSCQVGPVTTKIYSRGMLCMQWHKTKTLADEPGTVNAFLT